jgi:hypothetical protein
MGYGVKPLRGRIYSPAVDNLKTASGRTTMDRNGKTAFEAKKTATPGADDRLAA